MRFHIAMVAALVCFSAGAAHAATIVVNSTADVQANDGACTLREAIAAANSNTASGGMSGECVAGEALPTVDVISFAIPGTGVHTISPASALDPITEAVFIDAYTQPGASMNTLTVGDNAVLLIEISGVALPTGTDLFVFNGGGGSTARGLVVNHVTGQAFNIGSSNHNTITGNFIGMDASGTQLLSGTNPGIRVLGSMNTIGGTTPAARNVLAGSGGSGAGTVLLILADNNTIQGNYIGTNAAGSAALRSSNGIDGIEMLAATNNTIGGSAPGAGNVIVAGNVGIVLNSASNGNSIQGNFIGTDATATTGLGGGLGIGTANASSDNVIGGSAPGAGNVISGGTVGINLADGATGTTIQGNKIGTDAEGVQPIPNSGNGISVVTAAEGTLIGGTNPGAGNTIANNCGQGIALPGASTSLPMLGNSIFANGGLGISLDGSSLPKPNDDGDGDSGPNNLQNYPVITSAVVSAGMATISGTLNSTANTTFRVELFASVVCNASGFGEGQTFIGSTSTTTNGSGDASFGPLLFSPVADGQTALTATATDADGNTSEFSQCVGGIGRIFANGFEPSCGGS
jgi:CSLREA domain-containing protein